MMTADQHPDLDWRGVDAGEVPVSRRFGDPYYSLEGGLAETRHVFLAGNGLPSRFRAGFHIAELGFGTGLNMLASLLEWRASGTPGPLRYTSFEAFPLPAADIARALAAFPEAAAAAGPFLAVWATGARRIEVPGMVADIITGDARAQLPDWPGRADAWYLDGFSPARNPEMWGAPLLEAVARHTVPGGTCASYSAAGFVRRGLQAAGFQVTRVPGFGAKRHMTCGVMPDPSPPPPPFRDE